VSITVKLLQSPPVPPVEMASHAALTCYQPETPALGKVMPVETALFNTGHHTTLQHTSYTFNIEGISVGDITLGFHLANPFYDSDQRSGRYCSEMFANPDVTGLAHYIRTYWPGVADQQIWQITDYVQACIAVYCRHKEEAAVHAMKVLLKERPFYSQEVGIQADKIAQEQMRVLIPVIMPTAFDYSVNLSTVVALYKSAFTPVMRAVTAMMADEVVKHDPRTSFMFVRDEIEGEQSYWSPSHPTPIPFLVEQPTCTLFSVQGIENFVLPDDKKSHPVDQLHFRPELMDNSIGGVTTQLTLSLMTMGQNQRHRTVHRSTPIFTGGFYVPPLLVRCRGLQEEYLGLANWWVDLSLSLPPSLSAIIAPYGTMVMYKTRGDFNALAHEHAKRLCWNAQEEIYNLSRQLREQIAEQLGKGSSLLAIFEPPCYRHGKCLEGKRCCGRRISVRKSRGNYYPRRVI
jgi:hypothetical protein